MSHSPPLLLFPSLFSLSSHLLHPLYQEYDKWLWSIDTSYVGQPTAKDWFYAPDRERVVTNKSLGDLVVLMKVVNAVERDKRIMTMTGELTAIQPRALNKSVSFYLSFVFVLLFFHRDGHDHE